MKSWGVAIAGEKKMRAVSNQIVGENLKAEAVPLSFRLKDGGEEIRPAPMAYIPNLWQKIEDMLNESDNNITEYVTHVYRNACLELGLLHICSVHRVTWHKGAIPDDEIWVKIGGDMGGNTFKMCFQICNMEAPNSPQNTCVFSIFEAPDTYTNMWIGLDRFRSQIAELESHTWR